MLANIGFTPILYAQSTAGITNQPDTSYTTYSAYINTRKTYPNIKIVKEFKFDSVSEVIGITYCDVKGRQLKIDAFYPNRPAAPGRIGIIIIHGGGWRSGNRTQHYPLAQKLTRNQFHHANIPTLPGDGQGGRFPGLYMHGIEVTGYV